jgi:hypothetical protein
MVVTTLKAVFMDGVLATWKKRLASRIPIGLRNIATMKYPIGQQACMPHHS